MEKLFARCLLIVCALGLGLLSKPLLEYALYGGHPVHNIGLAQHDVNTAIARGDKRFLAAVGMGICVPGIEDDIFNPLVRSYGMGVIAASPNCNRPASERRWLEHECTYAQRYNTMLYEKLWAARDSRFQAMKARIEKQVHLFNTTDPRKEAARDFHRHSVQLYMLSNGDIPGTPNNGMDRRVYPMDNRSVATNASVSQRLGLDFARFQKYVQSYNAELFRLSQLKRNAPSKS